MTIPAIPDTHEIDALVALFNQGRYTEAEICAQRMTLCFPGYGMGWKCLGATLKLSGRSQEALLPMQKAVTLIPDDAAAQSNLGVILRELEQLSEAETICRRALAITPDFSEAHYNLANTLGNLGRTNEAEASYCSALEFKPDYAEAHNNLGVTLKDLGRLGEAEASFSRTLRIKPDYAEAYNNRGTTHIDLGQLAEAAADCRRALMIRPDFAEAQSNLGNILKEMGRLEEAETSCRRALKIKQDFAGAHSNLGNILKELGRPEEAEISCCRAIGIKPDFAEAYNNLGNTLKDLFRLEKAEAIFRRALEIKPNYAEVHNNLGVVLRDTGQLEGAEAFYRRALEIKPDFSEARSNLLFSMNCAAGHPAAYCLEEARIFGRLVSKPVKVRFPSWQCMPNPECLRIGLVTGDLHSHPVGYFLETLLTQINRSRVELFAYPTDRKADELTNRIRPYFSAWKPLTGLSDEAAARLIHADGVHLLLDLAGHTAKNRLPMFAWKPAPVQTSWLGYFATTGVAEIDYLLADKAGVPEELQGQFTEKVWYLPDTRLCFSPPDIDLAVAELPALKAGHITFGCFQSMAKVENRVLTVWGEILNALPKARLRLQSRQLGDPEAIYRLVLRLREQGIDPARVSIQGSIPRKAYLAAHAEVDLILDTFPYPGGTTTCEALWMGVPTLTLAGASLLSRQGASLLEAAGLPDWVADSEADYIDKAVTAACDLPKLAALRAGLRQQVLASPLFDARRFARNFESALWSMWEGCSWNEAYPQAVPLCPASFKASR